MVKLKYDNYASGFGTLLIAFPVILICIFGMINYAMYSVEGNEEALNPNIVMRNQTEGGEEIPWWLEIPVGIVRWFAESPVGQVISGVVDGFATMMHYLALDIPLITSIAPYDIFIKAGLWACMIIGIIEVVWL